MTRPPLPTLATAGWPHGLLWLVLVLLSPAGAAASGWVMDFHVEGGVGCRDLDGAQALPEAAWRPRVAIPGTRTRVAGRVLWVRLQAQSPPPLPPTRLVLRWEHNARLFDWQDPTQARLQHEPGHAPGFTVVRLPQLRDVPLYLCLVAPAPRVEAFELMSPPQLQAAERAVVMWMSLLIGLVLAVSVLGVALNLRLREPMFGWYSLFSLSLLGFLLGGLGVLDGWLPTAVQASNLGYALTVALGGFSTAAGVHFSLRYTRIGESRPRVARILRGLAVWTLLSVALILLNVAPLALWPSVGHTVLVAHNLGIAAVILLLLPTVGLAAWQGQREARSFLLGWLPLMSLLVVSVLVTLGVLPTHLRPSPLWLLGGTALASLVLAWGLIDRARRDRMERDAATARARRDPLTGACSRAAVAPRLEAAGAGSVLLYLDIDHFKTINDRYGHAVGDRCLQRFARLCREQLRGVDVFARQGGEEFLALLPEITLPEALRVAERIRIAVAMAAGEEPVFTVSIGVARRGEGEPVSAWISRADQALYRAKAGGRDRVDVGD
ncbi:MAG: diguanylate cyclase [Xanthomonadales bacterium]|nr:diguanylate cyclase [Xanthomonadales bacterium]